MFKAIKKWYIELVEALTDLIKILLLNIPRLILILGCLFLWFYVTTYMARKFGEFGVSAMFITPLIPICAFIIVSDRILKRKANSIDPSEFIGKVYLDDPNNKVLVNLNYSIATILSTEPEYDHKGNRVYIVECADIVDGTKQNILTRKLPAHAVYRHIKISKIWVPKTIQEFLSSRKIT